MNVECEWMWNEKTQLAFVLIEQISAVVMSEEN